MTYRSNLTDTATLLEVIRDCEDLIPWPSDCNCGGADNFGTTPNLNDCCCTASQLRKIVLANTPVEDAGGPTAEDLGHATGDAD